jgi:membrane protease YdiL (CAAX protease family)
MSTAKRFTFKGLSVLIRIGIYLGVNYLLIFLVQVITGFFPIKGNALYFNLFLCILLLLFTGFILQLEKKSWKDIGCIPGNRTDALNLIAGTFAGIVMLVVTAYIIKSLVGFHWETNPGFQWSHFFTLFAIVFCSVFVQELAFRGYPFRIMLDRWGEWRTQIVIAILFGLMHVTNTMQLPEILLTMLTTGAGSFLFGIAVIKTKRLHLAVGLHFGWNFAQMLLPRSASQNGEGLWIVTGGSFQPEFSYAIWIVPYMLIVLTAYFVVRNGVKKRFLFRNVF